MGVTRPEYVDLGAHAAALFAGYHGDLPTQEQLTKGPLRNAYWQGYKAHQEGRGCGCPRCDE